MEACVHSFIPGTPTGEAQCKFCIWCLKICKFKCASIMLTYKAFFSLCPPLSLTLTLFLLPLLPNFLGFKERIDGDILFRAQCFEVSHYLCIVWLWVFIFASNCCRRKLLCWSLNKAIICEFSKISLEVTLLIHFC